MESRTGHMIPARPANEIGWLQKTPLGMARWTGGGGGEEQGRESKGKEKRNNAELLFGVGKERRMTYAILPKKSEGSPHSNTI